MLLTIVGYFYVIITSALHPFHVSVCEVYHNNNSNALEISMKIFTDDLELAIQNEGNPDFILLDTEPDKIDKGKIETYLMDKFKISINRQHISLKFLGFEIDGDAVLCYIESGKVKKVADVEILNSIITEVFDDQLNLTHFQYKDEMKSVKMSKSMPTGNIDTSAW